MPPAVKKAFMAFVDDIPDSKIEWQNYSHGQSHANVFRNDVKKEPFRVDLQKFTKDQKGYDPNDPYLQLAVQSNNEGSRLTSEAISKNLKEGYLGPVYASLKIHIDACPDAATFKELMLKAGKDCHLTHNGEIVSYCIQIEPDGSWRNHQTGETGKGTVIIRPGQKKMQAPAPQEEDENDKNGKGRKKGRKGGK